MKALLIIFVLFLRGAFAFASVEMLPVSHGQVVQHSYYTLSYNEEAEQANWVFYRLTKQMVENGLEKRTGFRSDPLIASKSAAVKDYTHSGYDRGHLCPAADMAFAKTAMYESFYMSNISPQRPAFNRGIWKTLESSTREWAKLKDSLLVVTGPLFDTSNVSIGKNNVQVPSYFYKILYDSRQNKMIAFLLPNDSSSRPLRSFAASVDSLENLSGIDFFSQLPDHVESSLEQGINLAGWFEVEKEEPISKESPKSMLLEIIGGFVALLILILVYRRKRTKHVD